MTFFQNPTNYIYFYIGLSMDLQKFFVGCSFHPLKWQHSSLPHPGGGNTQFAPPWGWLNILTAYDVNECCSAGVRSIFAFVPQKVKYLKQMYLEIDHMLQIDRR